MQQNIVHATIDDRHPPNPPPIVHKRPRKLVIQVPQVDSTQPRDRGIGVRGLHIQIRLWRASFGRVQGGRDVAASATTASGTSAKGEEVWDLRGGHIEGVLGSWCWSLVGSETRRVQHDVDEAEGSSEVKCVSRGGRKNTITISGRRDVLGSAS